MPRYYLRTWLISLSYFHGDIASRHIFQQLRLILGLDWGSFHLVNGRLFYSYIYVINQETVWIVLFKAEASFEGQLWCLFSDGEIFSL